MSEISVRIEGEGFISAEKAIQTAKYTLQLLREIEKPLRKEKRFPKIDWQVDVFSQGDQAIVRFRYHGDRGEGQRIAYKASEQMLADLKAKRSVDGPTSPTSGAVEIRDGSP